MPIIMANVENRALSNKTGHRPPPHFTNVEKFSGVEMFLPMSKEIGIIVWHQNEK